MPTGKFKAMTFPCSRSVAIDGSGQRPEDLASPLYNSAGGQNVRLTEGLSSKRDRKTEMPSIIEVWSFLSIRFQSFSYQPLTASNCSFLSGSGVTPLDSCWKSA